MNQYAPNFIEEDGCLYELKGSADNSSRHKLCNFAPKLVREISVDDGVGTTTRIVLTGTHASGRTLPEIEINADELGSYEPKFVLFLTGRTGARKSTLAALFLSFFGNFSGANLPMSFQDTGNHILHNLFMLKDVVTCVDDYHPATRKAETVMREIFQTVCRAYGDRTGRGRLSADSTPMESRPPQGNAIITGEFLPDVGESGTARYLALELESNAVNLQLLSDVQRYAADGVFRNCMYGYIQWLKQNCLRDAETEARFIEWLGKRFESYRQEFYSAHQGFHGRVAETVAWLRLGMELYLSFLKAKLELTEDVVSAEEEKLRGILYELAKQQAKTIMQDKPTHT